jgi:hypothetical protein
VQRKIKYVPFAGYFVMRRQVPIAGEKTVLRARSSKALSFAGGEETHPSTPEVYRQLNGIPAHFGNAGALC